MATGERHAPRVLVMMKTRGALLAALVALGVGTTLAACGGGGGGGAVAPASIPTSPSGFVAAQGAITLIPAANGRARSDLLPGSAHRVMPAQVPTTPTGPPSGTALIQYAVTVTENAGTSPFSAGRTTASVDRALAKRIDDDRAARAAEGLRERAVSPEAMRRAFAGVRSQPISAVAGVRAPGAAPPTFRATPTLSLLPSPTPNPGGAPPGATNRPNPPLQLPNAT